MCKVICHLIYPKSSYPIDINAKYDFHITSMGRFSPSLLFTFIGGMITKVFCILLTLTTLPFYKNNFIRTKALILAKK